MAQKTYCVNTKCAKPIEYNYSKPNFCPHCGISLATLIRPTSPVSSSVVSVAPTASRFKVQLERASPAFAAVQKKMEARRSRSLDGDDDEDEDEDDFEESSAHIDFNNFQFNAVVRPPQEQKMTLGDFVNKGDSK